MKQKKEKERKQNAIEYEGQVGVDTTYNNKNNTKDIKLYNKIYTKSQVTIIIISHVS